MDEFDSNAKIASHRHRFTFAKGIITSNGSENGFDNNCGNLRLATTTKVSQINISIVGYKVK